MTHPKLCPICGGNLIPDTVTHEERDQTARFFVYQNVPALVCDGCGEYLLSDEVVATLERISETGVPIKKVETPVFDFVKAKTKAKA